MKDNKAKQSKLNGPNVGAGAVDTDIEWFNQFNDMPGICDVCTIMELKTLKDEMFVSVKNEINKFD